MGDFFCHSICIKQIVVFHATALSRSLFNQIKKNTKYITHKNTQTHAHWIQLVMLILFPIFEMLLFRINLVLFSYCFFSLLLLLLSLLFLLLVYSFSLAMLSVRWSTVIGLWLRVLSHNELTITTLFTVAPGCNLICSLSFSRKRYSFQSFWKLIILSSGSLVYSKLPIQSILYNRKYCLNNYLFEFYKFGIPCIIKVCLEHKLLKIGLKCWNVFWCVMKFLSFLLLIDLICLKDFNKILSKLLFICKSSPKFGHPMKRISDFNSLPIWQNHP